MTRGKPPASRAAARTTKRRAPLKTAFRIENYVPYLVNRAATAMLNYSAQSFKELGLTVPQWRILLTLWHHGECRFGALAELTSIEPPTLSRLLNALADDRIVKRARTEEDSRSVRISLTAKGRALFERSIPFAERTLQLYLTGLSASELDVLRRALTTIYLNVRRQYDAERSFR